MVSGFVVRLLSMAMLTVLCCSCHDQSTRQFMEPEQEVVPCTLLDRARVQFERLCAPGTMKPRWDKAYTADLPVGQGLVVPVYDNGARYVMAGRGKFAVNAVNYLLVYVGEDRQLCYELVAEPPVTQGVAPAIRRT